MADLGIAQRLKSIRESLGLKITDASKKLEFENYQTLTQIENGKRDIKASELSKFCNIYYCTITQILGYEEPFLNPVFKWRNTPKENKTEIEREILFKCNQYHLVESLLGIKPLKNFDDVTLEEINSNDKVSSLAHNISKKLKLGQRPAFSLQKVLEQNYGIKILYYSFSDGSAVSSVIPVIGKVIVINNDEPLWRQNFDLAHELFHLLTWKAVVSIQNNQNYEYNNETEKKADIFASVLLLPEKEITIKIGKSKSISLADCVDIAIEFGVSSQALLYRLYDLNYISFDKVHKIAQSSQLKNINIQKRSNKIWSRNESERFISLAIHCLRKGLISRGKFAELVGIKDRSDIDNFIAERGLMGEEGNPIEITFT